MNYTRRSDRELHRLNWGNRQRGTVLWLMGPTSAGKTTLALRVVNNLRKNGIPAICYDGDEIRALFGRGLGFSMENRFLVVSALVHLSNKATEAGLHVVVAALTAGKEARDHVRENVRNLTIGHVCCSINTCVQRDPKGLYKKAIRGEINTLIGYNVDYAPPDNPDFTFNTERYPVEKLANEIVSLYPTRRTRTRRSK